MPTTVHISDVMKKGVITVNPSDTCDKVLKYMVNLDIGSVIVVEKNKPIGIITDSNLLERVFYKKKNPAKTRARTVMSHPIRSISPNQDVEDALKLMRDLDIKRLPVTHKGKLVGVLSERDIMVITPAILEIITEREAMRFSKAAAKSSYTGVCESCGEASEDLKMQAGVLLCLECRGK